MADKPSKKSAKAAKKAAVKQVAAKATKPLFDHPDAQKTLATAIELLASESDRGAVIIGMDMVDAALEDLFKAIFPASLPHKKRVQLLEYPGVLSSVASKAAIAAAVRMIDSTLFDAITSLRKLRNQVAHSATAIRLADHKDRLKDVLALGSNVPVAVNQSACEILVANAIRNMREAKIIIDDKEVVPFATDQSAIEWLNANKEALGVLEERRHRYELAIGIGIICALLILDRDAIAAKFSGNTSIMK